MTRFAGIVSALLCSGALFLGCGAVTNAIDCHGICSRYQTCYDSKYDEAGCETRCRANANTDVNYMNKAATCETCLDKNKDCTSTTFACTGDCAGLVP